MISRNKSKMDNHPDNPEIKPQLQLDGLHNFHMFLADFFNRLLLIFSIEFPEKFWAHLPPLIMTKSRN